MRLVPAVDGQRVQPQEVDSALIDEVDEQLVARGHLWHLIKNVPTDDDDPWYVLRVDAGITVAGLYDALGELPGHWILDQVEVDDQGQRFWIDFL